MVDLTVVDQTLVAAATSVATFVTPTISLGDELLQVPVELTDPMYAKVVGPKVADITSQAVGGTGVFDVMMSTLSAHIKSEYQANRITGAEYAKSYVALTQLAMGSAVQFVLAKE